MRKNIIGRIFFIVLVAFILVIFLLPYVWMIGSSFKSRSELFSFISPVTWKTFLSVHPTLENFAALFEDGYVRNILNTFLESFLTVIFSTFICASMAYVFSSFEFPGRKVLYAVMVFTMMVPFEARMLPTYLVTQSIGLGNTFTGVWLPWVFDAFTVVLLTTHFMSVPRDMHNAALIDGCPHYKIMYKIMLPQILPALISAVMLRFFFAWDSYVWPLIILRNPDWQVLSVAIANLFTDQDIAWELVFSASLLSTVPVLVVFLFFQRYYVAGMTSGGVKE